MKSLKMAKIFFLLCLAFINCTLNSQVALKKCFKEKITEILASDYNSELHSNEELLLVVNFVDIENIAFKTAVISKDVFPEYLVGKNNVKPKGYFMHGEVIAVVYGNLPKFLDLKEVEKDMTFLEPFKMKEPEEGNPPFPPFLIEPLIYTFTYQDDYYVLDSKTVATTLLE